MHELLKMSYSMSRHAFLNGIFMNESTQYPGTQPKKIWMNRSFGKFDYAEEQEAIGSPKL